MRRPRADREEKRVTHGKGLKREKQLDPDNPNQRGLLDGIAGAKREARGLTDPGGLSRIAPCCASKFWTVAISIRRGAQPSRAQRAAAVPAACPVTMHTA